MTRPARPGDICVVVQDSDNEGRNIGKQLSCDRQCCVSDRWRCTTLEPFADFGGRCPAGAEFCFIKSHIRPLEDPGEPDATLTELPKEIFA